MSVAGASRSRRAAARYSMRVAGVVGVGRSMSWFLKSIGLTGGSMWCWQLGHIESSECGD